MRLVSVRFLAALEMTPSQRYFQNALAGTVESLLVFCAQCSVFSTNLSGSPAIFGMQG